MKKLMAGITVLALLCIASSAMAGGVKIPKAVCLDFTSYGDYHCLTLKSNGAVTTFDGKVTMYLIGGTGYTGASNFCPLTGTAYVIPGTTTMHANYGGKDGGATSTLRQWEVQFDLLTGTGTIYTRIDYANGNISAIAGTGVAVSDCSLLSIPSSIDGGDGQPFQAE